MTLQDLQKLSQDYWFDPNTRMDDSIDKLVMEAYQAGFRKALNVMDSRATRYDLKGWEVVTFHFKDFIHNIQ